MSENETFSAHEEGLINKINVQLQKTKDKYTAEDVAKFFEEIIKIFKEIREKIASHTNDENFAELEIDIEEVKFNNTQTLTEIRLTIRTYCKNRILRAISKKPREASTLILTPEGFRKTSEDRIEKGRLLPGSLGRRLRLSKYKQSTPNNSLNKFLLEFKERLENAASIKR